MHPRLVDTLPSIPSSCSRSGDYENLNHRNLYTNNNLSLTIWRLNVNSGPIRSMRLR